MRALTTRLPRLVACCALALAGGFACDAFAQESGQGKTNRAAASKRIAAERAAEVDAREHHETRRESPSSSVVPVAPVVPLVLADDASARPANGSLYTDDARGGDLLSDFKARRIGDLIFVDVVEASEAKVTSNAKRSRDSGALGGIVGAAGAIPMPGAAVVAGVIGGLGTRKFEGKGETGRSSSLRARIAARVVEVLPNGDLRVEALKVVKINKENERLRLCGIVRQRDVSAENSVPTTMVGELSVELNGKGVASADNAPGWLSRLFEKITPF